MSPVKTNYIADIFNYNTTTKTSTHIIKAGVSYSQSLDGKPFDSNTNVSHQGAGAGFGWGGGAGFSYDFSYTWEQQMSKATFINLMNSVPKVSNFIFDHQFFNTVPAKTPRIEVGPAEVLEW